MNIKATNVADFVSTTPQVPARDTLAVHVQHALERYFEELNGQTPNQLYTLVLSEVERPMLEVVMKQTRGNISKAAQYLGMNRATLRKKLEKYGLDN